MNNELKQIITGIIIFGAIIFCVAYFTDNSPEYNTRNDIQYSQ